VVIGDNYGNLHFKPERGAMGIYGHIVTEYGSNQEVKRIYYIDQNFVERDRNIDLLEFKERVLGIFAGIDRDTDFRLSDEELIRAMHSSSFKGRNAQVVAALYHCRSMLGKLGDESKKLKEIDRFMQNRPPNAPAVNPPDGLSRCDIEALSNNWDTLKEESQATELALWAERSKFFSEIDKNGDGLLTQRELEFALKSLNEDSKERNYAQIMLSNYRQIASYWGIDKCALQKYLRTVQQSESYKLQSTLLFYLHPSRSSVAAKLQNKGIQ